MALINYGNFMSNPPTPEEMTPRQQRRQASRVLWWLQLLLLLCLTAMVIWLFFSQQRFESRMNERLQSNEQVTTRLNDMDDRLHAISQQALPQQSQAASSQAQNQLDLLRIQLQATERLLADNDYDEAVSLLRGMHWQLSQPTNEISSALTIVLQQSLNKDIERLQAMRSQPSPWQLHTLAMQDIQTFLRSQLQLNAGTSPTASNTTGSTSTASPRQPASSAIRLDKPLTSYDVLLHEVVMTLNLAMQASDMRQSDMMVRYLQQAKIQLQPLQNSTLLPSPTPSRQSPEANTSSSTTKGSSDTASRTRPDLRRIQDVIIWLDDLIANAPKPTVLLTAQMLENPDAS